MGKDENCIAENLAAWGWDFMPTGPDEWEWLKFDATGACIARQGDAVWKRDLLAATDPR